MKRILLLALAGFVWACGGEMKPAAHPDARPEASRENTNPTGGLRMLSDAQIKSALSAEKEIDLIRVLEIQEKGKGTRSYGTEYKIEILQSVSGKPTGKSAGSSAGKSEKKSAEHWGAPVLVKGGFYVVILAPYEQSWATEKDAVLPTKEAEADAVFKAHRQKVDSLLGAVDLLPDSELLAALAGESSIVLANLNLGAGSAEGVSPQGKESGASWNCLMYVKETLAGPAKGNFTVPMRGPVGILPGTDYILSVRPKEAGPQDLMAVEVFPANREKRVKLHKDRLSALRN